MHMSQHDTDAMRIKTWSTATDKIVQVAWRTPHVYTHRSGCRSCRTRRTLLQKDLGVLQSSMTHFKLPGSWPKAISFLKAGAKAWCQALVPCLRSANSVTAELKALSAREQVLPLPPARVQPLLVSNAKVTSVLSIMVPSGPFH